MPIIKSAIKRMKQTAKRRERNIGIKRDIKGAVKAFIAKPTVEGLSAAQSEIDTAVKKKLIKKATASRRKAGLSKVAKEAGVKITTTTKKVPAKTIAAKKPVAKPVAKPVTKPAAKAVTKTATKKAVVKKPVAKK